MPQLELGLDVASRLGMCRNLLETHQNRKRADGNTRALVLVKHRAAAIRRALLGSAGGAVALADELLSPALAGVRLNEVLDDLEGKPPAELVRGALYVKGLAHVLSALTRSESRFNVTVGAVDYVAMVGRANGLLGGFADTAAQNDHVIDEAVRAGKFGDELRSELAAAMAAGAVRRASQNSLVVQMAAQFDKVQRDDQAFRERFNVLRVARSGGVDINSEMDKLLAEWDEFRKEILAPVEEARNQMLREEYEAEKNARVTVGNKIINRLMATSSVSEDAAKAWADAQEITIQAKARLRKIGYPVDDVRRDMAEFYRITGGRLPAARIHSDGDKRANATDIEAHGKVGTINLGTGFNKKTLWHELGHHLEADPVAKASAGRYIRRRSVDGGKVYSLRSMTGIKGYGVREVALRCNFFDPYVGKVYDDGATEVFSMGVETLSDPVLLAKRAIDDPETLEFITGYLAAPLGELGRAHMRLRDMLREAQDDALQSVEAESEVLIAKVAAKVQFTPSQDRAWMGHFDWMFKDDKVIGYFDLQSGARWWAISTKIRAWRTKRKVSGFRILQPSDSSVWSKEFPSKNFELLKVAMHKFERDGIFPSDPEILKTDITLKGML